MKSTCVIGLDLGTTSTKATAFSEDNVVIAQAAREVKTIYGQNGEAEQDPKAVADAAMDALIETAQAAQKSGYSVSLVGFSAAMHSLILLDSDGKPLTNSVIWMDGRAAEEAHQLRHSDTCGRLYQRTGAPIHPMTPLLKLIWFQKHDPNLLQKTRRAVSQKEFIWAQWFNEWVIDESMAGATGMYALKSGTWDEEALALAGISEDQLSKIVPATYCKRDPVHKELQHAGFADAVFNIGSSDGLLANLGVGALQPETMVLTLGTSCALRMTTAEPAFDVQQMPFCYRLDDAHYVVGGPSNSGGIVVDWLANTVLADGCDEGADDRFDGLLAAAEKVDPEELICLPYIAGERAPLWDASSTGSLIGLQVNHQPAHIFRAGLEGILMNARWIAESLQGEGFSPKHLVASGKLLENDFTRQLCADIFNLPVVGREQADASVVGAVTLARIATGAMTYQDVAADPLQNSEVTQPNKDLVDRYTAKYHRFRSLVEAVMSY